MHGVWLWGLALATGSALAAPYKCLDAQGRVGYSDRPCPAGAAASAMSSAWQRPAPVAVPPMRTPDLSALPRDAQGRPVVASSPQGQIVLETGARGPTQLLAACSVLVSSCVKPPERSLDACMLSAPRCTSEQAWKAEPFVACCPSLCAERYEAARRQGVSALEAFDRTLFARAGAGSCVAGLR